MRHGLKAIDSWIQARQISPQATAVDGFTAAIYEAWDLRTDSRSAIERTSRVVFVLSSSAVFMDAVRRGLRVEVEVPTTFSLQGSPRQPFGSRGGFKLFDYSITSLHIVRCFL